jgi:hypothetical protein
MFIIEAVVHSQYLENEVVAALGSRGLVTMTMPPRFLPKKTEASNVCEINPLVGPKCKGKMRILALVNNQEEIPEIPTSLEIPKATAPPRYQELHNRSCSIKFYAMTSSKRWRSISYVLVCCGCPKAPYQSTD